VQLFRGEEPDAAGGEEALEEAPVRARGREDAHDGQAGAGFEDAVGLPEGRGRVAELVEGAAADGAGEAGVGEGEGGRVGATKEGGRRPSGPGGRPRGAWRGRCLCRRRPRVAKSAGEVAGVEARGAAEVEVEAAAFEAYLLRDDLYLALVREFLPREQVQGADAPEGLVAAAGAGEKVGEVRDVVAAEAALEQVQVAVLYRVRLAGGGDAGGAGEDDAVLLDPLVVERPGASEGRGLTTGRRERRNI
jgi:hypothetical protein